MACCSNPVEMRKDYARQVRTVSQDGRLSLFPVERPPLPASHQAAPAYPIRLRVFDELHQGISRAEHIHGPQCAVGSQFSMPFVTAESSLSVHEECQTSRRSCDLAFQQRRAPGRHRPAHRVRMREPCGSTFAGRLRRRRRTTRSRFAPSVSCGNPRSSRC